MLYIYDANKLLYRKANLHVFFYILVLTCIAAIFGFTAGKAPMDTNQGTARVHFSEDTVVLSTFTPEGFITYMKEINIKYPHIVYAQALVESNHFKSKIFQENHNLFGMKQARVRCNLAKTTERGHASYDHWTESVVDYALYQSSYLYGIKSESDYFAKLKASYAGDPDYVDKLKTIIKKENLEEYVDSI